MALKRFFLLLLTFIFISCDNTKQQRLLEREQAVAEREQQFADKEAEYQTLIKMRDSLRAATTIKDSIPKATTWPDSLKIAWNSKMVCRESNCSNYVIGDQRNEVWQFVSDSTGLYANVLNNSKLTRVFRGQYNRTAIRLDFETDSAAKSGVKMNIVLDDLKKNVIKGTQTLTGKDNCKATFSVELTPSSPKK